jgi:hypothetical protein
MQKIAAMTMLNDELRQLVQDVRLRMQLMMMQCKIFTNRSEREREINLGFVSLVIKRRLVPFSFLGKCYLCNNMKGVKGKRRLENLT